MIEVGNYVGTYQIQTIAKGYCYAERTKKINVSDYVVWSVDHDGNGVNTGRYFESRTEAIRRYQELITA